MLSGLAIRPRDSGSVSQRLMAEKRDAVPKSCAVEALHDSRVEERVPDYMYMRRLISRLIFIFTYVLYIYIHIANSWTPVPGVL